MTQALVRIARASDIPAITAIYSESVMHGTASFELEPPDEAEMRRRFDAITGAGYPYLVAELAGKVVGYAYANAYRTRPAYRFTVEDSIYLAPDMQGKGIGRALLDALVGACTERGYRLMLAVIGELGAVRVDPPASQRRLHFQRHAALGRLQVRTLARQHRHGAAARRR